MRVASRRSAVSASSASAQARLPTRFRGSQNSGVSGSNHSVLAERLDPIDPSANVRVGPAQPAAKPVGRVVIGEHVDSERDRLASFHDERQASQRERRVPPTQQSVEDRHAVASPAQKRERQEDQEPTSIIGTKAVTAPNLTKKWAAWMTMIVTLGSGSPKSLKIASNLGTM